jgi:hypothetical protein
MVFQSAFCFSSYHHAWQMLSYQACISFVIVCALFVGPVHLAPRRHAVTLLLKFHQGAYPALKRFELVPGALVVHHPVGIVPQGSFMNANLIEVLWLWLQSFHVTLLSLSSIKNCSLLEPWSWEPYIWTHQFYAQHSPSRSLSAYLSLIPSISLFAASNSIFPIPQMEPYVSKIQPSYVFFLNKDNNRAISKIGSWSHMCWNTGCYFHNLQFQCLLSMIILDISFVNVDSTYTFTSFTQHWTLPFLASLLWISSYLPYYSLGYSICLKLMVHFYVPFDFVLSPVMQHNWLSKLIWHVNQVKNCVQNSRCSIGANVW